MNGFASVVPWIGDNLKIYNKATYFRFLERDKSEFAQRLNRFRVDLVKRHLGDERILDIGVGAGTFMQLHGNCLGFDINPYAVRILKREGLFFDPHKDDFGKAGIRGLTYFDSLEHIDDPGRIIDRLNGQMLFVSTPIFHNAKHLLNSKHFKPAEHYWHFTEIQFGRLMGGCGYEIVETRRDETEIGRTDIRTFVLKRKKGNGSSKV